MIFCSDSSFKFSLSPVTSLQVNERHEKRSSFIVEKLDNLMKGWKDPTRVGLWTAEGPQESWHFKLIINKRRRKDILIKSPNSGSFRHQLPWAPWIWLPRVLYTRTGLECRMLKDSDNPKTTVSFDVTLLLICYQENIKSRKTITILRLKRCKCSDS